METLFVEYADRVLAAPADPGFHAAVRALLADRHVAAMDAFLRAAHERMPAAGHTTYIDAAVLKVLACASLPGLHAHVARECISTLDHAVVIAGAATDDARRDYVVHDVIRHLQSAVPWHTPSTAVLAAGPGPVPPPSTARHGVPALAAPPSILDAPARWSRLPFVVPGHARDWPAVHRWPSLAYLFAVAGPGRIVPVEVGDDYRSDDWSPELVGWEAFLASLAPDGQPHQTVYLAQHSLLSQFPPLRQDILLPDLVYASLDAPDFPPYQPPSNVIVNAWLGPKGTVSPAHTDPFFNCYVQVVGRKTVWLAPPGVAPAMYPYQSSGSSGSDRSHNPAANTTSPLMSNTSRVDVFSATPHTSQSAFPLFWDVVPGQASSVTLNPGDLLFFPPGWWHAMRSEDASFSVSMWF